MIRYPFPAGSQLGSTIQHAACGAPSSGGIHALSGAPIGGGTIVNRMYALSMIGQQLRMLHHTNSYGTSSNNSSAVFSDNFTNN